MPSENRWGGHEMQWLINSIHAMFTLAKVSTKDSVSLDSLYGVKLKYGVQ